MTEYRFIEALDVLHLRGNRLFGEAGTHASALMPPWPSLVAGALRSRMLVDHGIEPGEFAAGNRPAGMSEALHTCLGTPAEPGNFRVSHFTLARRTDNGIEPCFPLPADLVANENDAEDAEDAEDADRYTVTYLQPGNPAQGLASSFPLPMLPVLATAAPAKPESGLWLNRAGLKAYLAGEIIKSNDLTNHLIESKNLWQLDPRLGIALDGHSRTAADGRLYTAEAVALRDGVGFLVGVENASGLLPTEGLLRFGGDGRGARLSVVGDHWPVPDKLWERITNEKRCRLVLTSPGIFEQGWRLPGLDGNGNWKGPDITGRLVSASVSRSEVVGGVDLAAKADNAARAKTARRAAPTGSVYWLEDLKGDDIRKSLKNLHESGWWAVNGFPDPQRRAEGFNNVMVAAWPH